MTARTFEQDSHPVIPSAANRLSDIGARLRDGLRALGPYGRRYILTGIGAACALGLGVAAALAVQLPSDMKDPVQAQEQTLAQTELPSEAQALANALNNPPAFAAPDDHSADVAVPPDPAVESTTADLDEKPTGPTSVTTTADDDPPTESHLAKPAPVSAAPKDNSADARTD